MENIKTKILEYKRLECEIFESFGCESAYGEIDLRIDVKWNMNENEVWWIDDIGEIYSNEICNSFLKSHDLTMTMLYVNNGCVENFYNIFDNSLRDKNLKPY